MCYYFCFWVTLKKQRTAYDIGEYWVWGGLLFGGVTPLMVGSGMWVGAASRVAPGHHSEWRGKTRNVLKA